MSGEHVVFSGGNTPPPILLDVTCTRCWRIYRYDVPLTGVINQILTDEGWRFPGTKQICPNCLGDERITKAIDEWPIAVI